MIIRNVDIRQIQSGETLPQYLPIFKINRGEHDELSCSNPYYSNIDFVVYAGSNAAARAEYTFCLEQNKTTANSTYYLKAKNQNKSIMCYVTEDDEFIYVCVKVNRTYYPLHAELRITPSAAFMYTPCSYGNHLDPDEYEFKEAASEGNLVIRDNFVNANRNSDNSVMHTAALASGKYLKIIEMTMPSSTTEKVSSWEKTWLYGEMLLYISGLYNSTKACLLRIAVNTQGFDGTHNINVTPFVLAGELTYRVKATHDDNKLYIYIYGDPNSRPIASLLSASMMKGNVALVCEETEEPEGEDIPVVVQGLPETQAAE